MSKYIGFDMDSKKTVCCVVEAGQKDKYRTIGPDVKSMRKFLKAEKQGGYRV